MQHPSASYDLAVCYEKGRGVKTNKKKALELFVKAAKIGDTHASLEAGRMYYWGIGTSKDLGLSKDFFLRAARGKIAEAEYYVGLMYEHGDGLKQNLTNAIKWYARASAGSGDFGKKALGALARLKKQRGAFKRDRSD